MTPAIESTPALGQAVRHEWGLDPAWLSVNHGSFGAAPRRVLGAQDEWRRRMEAQPGRFMRRELPDALRNAAAQLASFIGADAAHVVFVENATTGCNAVLRSLTLAPGDEVVVLTHGYAAVRNAVRFVSERADARTVEAAVPFPRPEPKAIVAGVLKVLSPRTRLAVIDHITSPSALVLPVADVVAACHRVGIPVLVDGAHGPGQVPLDMRAIGADWYAGNCHKWLCAPKGCGFLWAAPERQAGLHPVTISHGFGKGFLSEFEWTGTRDPSAFLSVSAALDFHQRLGGASLMARNTALAAQATALLAECLGTEIGAPEGLAGAMGSVRLPITGTMDEERVSALRERFLDEKTDAPVHILDGAAWLRISAHAYNDMDDYARLAEIVTRVARAG